MPDETTAELRRLENHIHAILARNLIPPCPAADLFGPKGAPGWDGHRRRRRAGRRGQRSSRRSSPGERRRDGASPRASRWRVRNLWRPRRPATATWTRPTALGIGPPALTV